MKVLYAIQGTGNGHLSRARDIVPILQKKCDLDILVSGYQAEVELPFEVKYRLRGLSFIFGKSGGVDIWNTYMKANSRQLMHEIDSLPVEDYDLVINDFEPVSAWACYLKKLPCIALSHQSAVLHKNAPKPKPTDLFGQFILKNYAPNSSAFGFHFAQYGPQISTPVIRNEIRTAQATDNGHYTVYLPSYDNQKIIAMLEQIPQVEWQVFSKFTKVPFRQGNISIEPVNNERFLASFLSCKGILTGAGFETPAEALYLGKKLMAIPMKNQYEQQCNAAALKQMGVKVIKNLKPKQLDKIKDWVQGDYTIKINYPDNTEAVINKLLESHIMRELNSISWANEHSLVFAETNHQNQDSTVLTSGTTL